MSTEHSRFINDSRLPLVTWTAASRAACIHHVSTALGAIEGMYYQFMHGLNIKCNYIQSRQIGKHWIICFRHVESGLICKHVSLSSGCHFPSTWEENKNKTRGMERWWSSQCEGGGEDQMAGRLWDVCLMPFQTALFWPPHQSITITMARRDGSSGAERAGVIITMQGTR